MRFPTSSRTMVGVCVVGCASVAVWVGTRTIVAQQFTAKALTVTYVETHFSDTNGAVIARSEKFLAVRGDGSRVEPRSAVAPDGKTYDQKLILDAEKGKRIVVEGMTQSVTTTMLSDMELRALNTPGGGCLDPQAKEAEPIQGYSTVRTELRTPVMIVDRWLAPDLGCVALRETVSRPKPDGTAATVFTRELAALHFGEPDAVLFQAPDWPESAPSQVMARFRQKFNRPDSERQRSGYAQKDRAYWAAQRKRP